ncbi:MAG: hypothetical protein IT423_13435 [Pirellulaceae bacterium]|nr:hypothetical protein [Pirellulaceae bacterium]
MSKLVRLFGKKRGSRMSGWWVIGSASEAAFFGSLFLLGIVSLTVVGTWQLFWPQSQIIRVGFGFWLMMIASLSFVVIGLSGLILRVAQTVASPELRSALAQQAEREHQRRSRGPGATSQLPNVPSLQPFTDSPGERLAYRLASQRGEIGPLVLSFSFAAAWNGLLAVLLVIAVGNFARGTPNWFLTLLLVPFAAVGVFSARWFFTLFRRLSGLGPTIAEISHIPLMPGETFSLYVCQYGRVSFRRLSLAVICFEESTYQQGTDVRTERVQVVRHIICERENCRSEPDEPLELDCQFRLPSDTMHSFQGQHNAIVWKVVVEGDSTRWPSFCRSFPVVVYPPSSVARVGPNPL